MQITPTKLPGVFTIDPQPIEDDRGFFARSFSEPEFAEHGIESSFLQHNISFNHQRGTLRGMHWQNEPHAETKVVRCTRGGIFDVAVDLRKDSPTYLQWHGEELTAENRRMLIIPPGCGHGYQTLTDDAEVFYLVSQVWAPGAEGGAPFDDPAFGIEWPREVTVISERDQNHPAWQK